MAGPNEVYTVAMNLACSKSYESLSVLSRSNSFESVSTLMSAPTAPAPAGLGAVGTYAQLSRPGTLPKPQIRNPTDVARHTHGPVARRRPRLNSTEYTAMPPADLRPGPKGATTRTATAQGKKTKKAAPLFSIRVMARPHAPVKLKLSSQPVEEMVLSMSSDTAAAMVPYTPAAPASTVAAPTEPAVLQAAAAPAATLTPAAAAPPVTNAAMRAEILSGAAAGGAVSGLLFPLNTIKTRLMAGSTLLGKGVLQGLWAGARFDMTAQACSTAVFFGAYGRLKRRLAKADGELDTLGSLQAGAGAAFAASLLAVPAEVVRQNVQARVFASPRAAVSGILSKRGPTGLYAGYGASLARDLPFDTVQIMVYEALRRGYLAATSRAEVNAAETAGLGGAAGALTGFVTAPLDVVRTHAVLSSSGQATLSLRAAAGDLLRQKGMRGLFRGAGTRSLEIALGGMVFFTVLEHVQALLNPSPSTAAVPTPAPAPAPTHFEPQDEALHAYAYDI